jgi:ABC-type thiamine transport system ATPase subunit
MEVYLKERLTRLFNKYLITKETRKNEKEALKLATQTAVDTKEAQKHLQALAQALQQQAHKQIARIVSRCLKAVFGNEYDFRIEFEQKRGKTEADLLFLKNGRKEDPRLTSGGQRDVAGLALRLVALTLSNPAPRRLLLLDEPFSSLDNTNRPKIAALLETLSKELNLQIIMVTHIHDLELGTVIEL